ncbi:hypothetical protein LSAJ156_390040 [Latilactobacillus sakei]|nr:hypothetical protein LSAJ156_390040 [Latilactobacillus sakei]SOB40163.1 hypothetical protein LSAJ160_260022 [Latilactobacillus sakei]SOB40178.1 hypothetical protein LSAJ18_210039 [Latilactobacillus sakei]SOB44275.1 hypothetical protein LSAJ112_310040 [Latilactobacillus sakei]SON65856.1 protein of unknown function [Latilactobacillus sakei]
MMMTKMMHWKMVSKVNYQNLAKMMKTKTTMRMMNFSHLLNSQRKKEVLRQNDLS